MKKNYQFDFSSSMPGMYDIESRERKAKTMVAILSEFYANQRLSEKNVLDVGSSTGIIDNYLSNHFGKVYGIDIDEKAVAHASNLYRKENLEFSNGDAMHLQFPDALFDVVICSHVYEHVPDSDQLMREIYRVLKPSGVCFFAAGNRITLIEPHHRLPLLSMLPKSWAHLYMKLTGKGNHYYEDHLTYWSLQKLTQNFICHDYTKKILNNPDRYAVSYMLKPDSMTTKIARLLAGHLYWAFPNYIWLLQRPPL